jgi:hypothetical protein
MTAEWVMALPGLVIFVLLSAMEARFMYQGKHRQHHLKYRNRQQNL